MNKWRLRRYVGVLSICSIVGMSCSPSENATPIPEHAAEEIGRNVTVRALESAIVNDVNNQINAMFREAGVTDPNEKQLLSDLDRYLPLRPKQGIVVVYLLALPIDAVTQPSDEQMAENVQISRRSGNDVTMQLVRVGRGVAKDVMISVVDMGMPTNYPVAHALWHLGAEGEWIEVWAKSMK